MWTDSTSYSRTEPYSERKPRSWRLRLTPDVVIHVTSEHIYYPGEWSMTCEPFFARRSLNMSANKFTAEQAQAAAVALVREEVEKLKSAIDKI